MPTSYGEHPHWGAGRPRIRPFRLVLSWLIATASLMVAALIVPGASVRNFLSALLAAAVIAVSSPPSSPRR
jgi:hypothetical protein